MYKHLATSMDGFSGGAVLGQTGVSAIATGKNAYAGPVSSAAHCKYADLLADRSQADAGSGRRYGPHTVVSADFGNLAVDLGSNAVKALLVFQPVGVAKAASNLLADNLVAVGPAAVTSKLSPAYDTHEIRNAVA